MFATLPLIVVIPGLIWPRQALADLTQQLSTPALCRLLGRGRLSALGSLDAATAMLTACALPPRPLPVAALRRLAAGLPAAGRWLCLDPVHLGFSDRQPVLDDPAQMDLNAEEAGQFASSLGTLFSDIGELCADGPRQWHLRLTGEAPCPSSRDLPSLAGRRIDTALSTLDRDWRRRLNEAQMLLHAHPLNRAREAQGRLSVNSVWPWGGGTLPPAGAPQKELALLAEAAEWRGLATHLGAQTAPLPAAWPGATAPTSVVLLDGLRHPARSGDALAWRTELSRLEREWFAPLLGDLRSGKLAALRLCLTDDTADRHSHAWQLDVSRQALGLVGAFWRRPAALTTLATGA